MTVGVPNSLPATLGLGLSLPFLQILLRGLSLELFEFHPSVFEDLYGKIQSVDLGRTDISGITGRG